MRALASSPAGVAVFAALVIVCPRASAGAEPPANAPLCGSCCPAGQGATTSEPALSVRRAVLAGVASGLALGLALGTAGSPVEPSSALTPLGRTDAAMTTAAVALFFSPRLFDRGRASAPRLRRVVRDPRPA